VPAPVAVPAGPDPEVLRLQKQVADSQKELADAKAEIKRLPRGSKTQDGAVVSQLKTH